MLLLAVPGQKEPSGTVLVNIQRVGQIFVTHSDQNVILLEDPLPDDERVLVDLDALLVRIEIEEVVTVVHEGVGELRILVDLVQLLRHADRLLDEETGLMVATLDGAALGRLTEHVDDDPSRQVVFEELHGFFRPSEGLLKEAMSGRRMDVWARRCVRKRGEYSLHRIHYGCSRGWNS